MPDYNEIISQYKNIPGGILEAYHAVQREYGYLPIEAIRAAAQSFDIPNAEAFGTATFYAHLQIKKSGQNVIRICESAPCHVAGAIEVVAALEKALSIKMGERTPDGKFALQFAECVGQCQSTPVITINHKPYLNVTAEQVPVILGEYR